MKTILFALALGFFLFQSSFAQQQAKSPRNIILMIGDGMGVAQLYTTYAIKKDKTNITRCKYVALVNTSASDKLITDSAASGTAIATGTKTNNGTICIDPNGRILKTILEYAEDHHKATGLVATSAITHATPASFIAHNISRNNYEEIAYDFLKTDIEVFIGGGLDHFIKRQDGLNLVDSLTARNYQVVLELDQLHSIRDGKIAGLLYPKHPPSYDKGRDDFLEIASMKAIELLDKNQEGFFLMIEGSQIDWAGHDNNMKYLQDEMLDFDQTVGRVLEFAEKDGETLVIITADHETGGLTVVNGDLNSRKVNVNFSSGDHTPVFVPLFAFGPGADIFTGVYENTELFNKMMQAFGWEKD